MFSNRTRGPIKVRQYKSNAPSGTTYQREYCDRGFSHRESYHPLDQEIFPLGELSSITEYRNAFVKRKNPPRLKLDLPKKDSNTLKNMGFGNDTVLQQSVYKQHYLPIRASQRGENLLNQKHILHAESLFDKYGKRIGGTVNHTTTHNQEYLNPHRHSFQPPAKKELIKPSKIRLSNMKIPCKFLKTQYQHDYHTYSSPLKINTRYGMRLIPNSHIKLKGDINFDTHYKLAFKEHRNALNKRKCFKT